MRSRQNSQIANETVAIDTLLIDQTRDVVAVAIDQATDVVSGIGVDQDPPIAVEKCMLDVLRPNGWSPACGVPNTFSLDNAADKFKAARLAHSLGISIKHGPSAPKMNRSLAMLARSLITLPTVRQFWDRQLHCDCIQWALITNNSFHRGLGTTPEQAWRSARDCYGVRPHPQIFKSEGPRMIRVEVAASGSVEIEGETYADERIPIVANRALGGLWVDVLIFDDDRSLPVWVIDIGGRAFPIYKRGAEPKDLGIVPLSASTTRPSCTRVSSIELGSTDIWDDYPLDWNGPPPKFARRSRRSSHQRWVHDLADEIIERYWLTPERRPASMIFCIFQDELHRRAKQKGCDAPRVSASFLNRKLRKLDPYTVTRYRNGLAAARRQFLAARPTIRSSR